MNLVLVESPTKARMLSSFLGGDFRVEATMGHVRDLPLSKLGVEIEKKNDSFLVTPQYVEVEDRRSRINELRALYSQADSVVLATDPDREGEAIAFHVAELLKGGGTKEDNKKFQRVVFHQITKNAILDAMKSPRSLDMNLVDAQQARRVLDRVVGYELSPLLWKKIRRGLSAGRVQSVAVRMIVDREREIEVFVPIEYWEVSVEVSKIPNTSQVFLVKLIKIDGKSIELHTQKIVDPVVSDLEKSKYHVADVEKKEVRRIPYPPFTTSTLQQASSRLFHWSGKKTMSIAQQLYEHGYITYHRTDSLHVAQEAIDAVRLLIPDRFGPSYLPQSPRLYQTKKSALAQEAHEAIRVTNLADSNSLQEIESKISRMGREASRLYELVWKRFVGSQMADQIIDQTTVSVEAQYKTSPIYLLETKGEIEKFDGWRKLYQISKGKDQQSQKTNSEEAEQILPEVEKDEKLDLVAVKPEQKFTQPPARYTEATLIKTLEGFGIGRPSTYAPIISTIQDRGYVEKEEGRFYPTPVALVVNDFLVKYFQDIVDFDFTRSMEEDLDRIAQGEKKWNDVIGTFWFPFEEKLTTVEKDAAREKVPVEDTGVPCPTCHEGSQVIRSGRFGKFLSCSRFPECKWTATYKEKIGMKCPTCHDGDVIFKKTKKGKHFYGCSRYPDCTWASWTKPKMNEEKTATNEQPGE